MTPNNGKVVFFVPRIVRDFFVMKADI